MAVIDTARLRVGLQPKQARLLRLMEESPATVLGYGGSRGGAKSGGARRVMVLRRLKHPGSVGMIFRRTYQDLLDNHIEPMWRDFPALEKWYNKGEKTLTIPTKPASQIAFRYGETAADIDKFLGREYQDIYVDQAEGLTEDELVRLRTSCRWPGVPQERCKFILGFNPGGKGSGYLKRIFRDRSYRDGERATDYDFIQAYGWDNVEWVRDWLAQQKISVKTYYREWTEQQRRDCFLTNSAYGRMMAALPEGLRAGWLYGDFDSFAGQYFENFSPARHVVDAADMQWRPWFKRWIAIDWGYQHNAAVMWFTQAWRGPKPQGEPIIWCYRELVQNRLGSEELANRIVDLSAGEEIDEIYCDSGAKSQTDSSDTPYDQINRVFRERGLPQAGLANKDRVGGWRLMYDLLGPDETEPRFVISRECRRLIATIPMMSRDRTKVEDCEKFDANEAGEGGDDAADACRYGLLTRMRPGRKPFDATVHEQLGKIVDMTAKAMEHRRLLDERKRRGIGRFLRLR